MLPFPSIEGEKQSLPPEQDEEADDEGVEEAGEADVEVNEEEDEEANVEEEDEEEEEDDEADVPIIPVRRNIGKGAAQDKILQWTGWGGMEDDEGSSVYSPSKETSDRKYSKCCN
jgi:hypothetical protein